MTISVVFTANSFVPSANYYSCFVSRTNGSGYNDNYNLNLDYGGILQFRAGSGDIGGIHCNINNPIDLNKTYLCTASFEYDNDKSQTTVKMYLNGKLENQMNDSEKPLVNDTFKTVIGQYDNRTNGLQYLDGTIHSVRIYDRVLSDDEIEYNYQIDKQRYNIEE